MSKGIITEAKKDTIAKGKDLHFLNQVPESANEYNVAEAVFQAQISRAVTELKTKMIELVKVNNIQEAIEEFANAPYSVRENLPLIYSTQTNTSVFDELRHQDKVIEANMFGKECECLGYVAEFHYNWDKYN